MATSQTTVVNKRLHQYDVDITRNGPLGNPFSIANHETRERAIELFRPYFEAQLERSEEFRELVLACKGKRLGCVCKPQACHGDVIKEWLDERSRHDGI